MATSSTAALSKITLNVGDPAPGFTLATDGGGEASLEGFKGRNLVLYFYPRDDTPGCTLEAKDFRDLMKDFEKAGTAIVGVSKDDVKSHDAFKKKLCLPFMLASDEDGSACEAYGVWVEKSMYGKKYMGIERVTFLIDAVGKITHIWPKVKVEGHAGEVLEAARSLTQ